jgi:hypothetical protein
MVKKYLKKVVKHMSIDDGRFMVGMMNVGDSSEPQMHLEFSKDLTEKKLRYKIDMLKREGSRYSFSVASYRQAGYEVS